MPRPGTRENPLDLTAPEDLERATRHVHRPSPDQARAGNYRMGHVTVAGLRITIETPKDCPRKGVGPDSTPWSVIMPADYGYFKLTEASDGDHVDVYLGPNAHEAENFPVWIVDQCDADTGRYDEAKVMLGFPDVRVSRETYLAAFSDGRGAERVASVSRLTFQQFKEWLASNRTHRPLNSALGKTKHTSYGPVTACSCARCRKLFGGDMTTTPVSEPKAAGVLTNLWAKVMGRMTAEERVAMLQDAATMTSAELGKASDLLNVGDDHAHIGMVEDQWDGPPDGTVTVSSGHGPGSTASPGTVNVGPGQEASGDGAPKMEAEYSRHAPQGGVQNATEKLGRDVAGRAASKALLRAFKGLNMQMDILRSGTTQPLDEVAIKALVETAVTEAVTKALAGLDKTIAKAVRPLIARALEKAEEEEEEEEGGGEEEEEEEESSKSKAVAKAEESEEDEEAGQAESGEGTEIEIVNEIEDEEDDETGKSKAAAHLRVQAKSRLKWANRRLTKARALTAEGKKPKAASRQLQLADTNIAKAAGYLIAAESLRDGKIGPSSKALKAQLAKAKRGLAGAQSDNQDKWPTSKEKQVGKAAEETSAASTASAPDIAKASELIEKAAQGMGLLTADVRQLLEAVNSRSGGSTEAGGRLPPVFALAKAGGSAIAGVEIQLAKLRDDNVISFDDFDRARDALTRARMGMPADTVQALISRLHPQAQAVLNNAA